MPVDNAALREAMTRHASRDELFALLAEGDLLLDITGSSLTIDDGTIRKGSTFAIAEGEAPDGSRILLAFTRQEEAQRMHPDVPAETLAQPAAGVLEFARSQGFRWLNIDPESPASATLDLAA